MNQTEITYNDNLVKNIVDCIISNKNHALYCDLHHIAESLLKQDAVLFVGAGFSKNSSEKFPDWLQLINQLKQDLPEMKGRTLNSEIIRLQQQNVLLLNHYYIVLKEKLAVYDNTETIYLQLVYCLCWLSESLCLPLSFGWQGISDSYEYRSYYTDGAINLLAVLESLVGLRDQDCRNCENDKLSFNDKMTYARYLQIQLLKEYRRQFNLVKYKQLKNHLQTDISWYSLEVQDKFYYECALYLLMNSQLNIKPNSDIEAINLSEIDNIDDFLQLWQPNTVISKAKKLLLQYQISTINDETVNIKLKECFIDIKANRQRNSVSYNSENITLLLQESLLVLYRKQIYFKQYCEQYRDNNYKINDKAKYKQLIDYIMQNYIYDLYQTGISYNEQFITTPYYPQYPYFIDFVDSTGCLIPIGDFIIPDKKYKYITDFSDKVNQNEKFQYKLQYSKNSIIKNFRSLKTSVIEYLPLVIFKLAQYSWCFNHTEIISYIAQNTEEKELCCQFYTHRSENLDLDLVSKNVKAVIDVFLLKKSTEDLEVAINYCVANLANIIKVYSVNFTKSNYIMRTAIILLSCLSRLVIKSSVESKRTIIEQVLYPIYISHSKGGGYFDNKEINSDFIKIFRNLSDKVFSSINNLDQQERSELLIECIIPKFFTIATITKNSLIDIINPFAYFLELSVDLSGLKEKQYKQLLIDNLPQNFEKDKDFLLNSFSFIAAQCIDQQYTNKLRDEWYVFHTILFIYQHNIVSLLYDKLLDNSNSVYSRKALLILEIYALICKKFYHHCLIILNDTLEYRSLSDTLKKRYQLIQDTISEFLAISNITNIYEKLFIHFISEQYLGNQYWVRATTPLEILHEIGTILSPIKSLDLEGIHNNIAQYFINRRTLPSSVIIDILRVMPKKNQGVVVTQIKFCINEWNFFETNQEAVAQCIINQCKDFKCETLLQIYEILAKYEPLRGGDTAYLTLVVRTACVIAISKNIDLESKIYSRAVDLQNTIIAEIQKNITKLRNQEFHQATQAYFLLILHNIAIEQQNNIVQLLKMLFEKRKIAYKMISADKQYNQFLDKILDGNSIESKANTIAISLYMGQLQKSN